jgi:hypothetical protein
MGRHPGMQTALTIARPLLGQVEVAGDRHAGRLGGQRQADQRLAVGRRADQTRILDGDPNRMLAALEQGRVIDDPVLNGAALLHHRHDPTEHPLSHGAVLPTGFADEMLDRLVPARDVPALQTLGSMLLRSPGSNSPVM